MMHSIHPHSAFAEKSEIDLFSIPPTQTTINESIYASFNPISSVSGDLSPIEYIIPASGELYIDPSNIFLAVKGRIQNHDGSALPAESKVYPECNILHSLFNGVEIYLNETNICGGSYNYAYRAYIENLLNFTKEAKDTVLRSSGFYTDSKKASEQFSKYTRKNVDVYGKLRGDIFSQDKLLPNGVSIKIKLTRSPHAFTIKLPESDTSDSTAVFNIIETYLYVRHVRLSPSVHLSIETSLMKSTAKYPITRVVVKHFTLPGGLSSKGIDNISIGNLPLRMVVGFVSHKSFNANHKTKAFDFKHFNMKRLSTYVNGSLVSRPIDTKFSDSNNYASESARAFSELHEILGCTDTGIGITLDEYLNGSTLFAFNLAADDCSSCVASYINPIKQGSLSISAEFEKPLLEPVTIVLYLEYYSLIEIDHSRNILLTF